MQALVVALSTPESSLVLVSLGPLDVVESGSVVELDSASVSATPLDAPSSVSVAVADVDAVAAVLEGAPVPNVLSESPDPPHATSKATAAPLHFKRLTRR